MTHNTNTTKHTTRRTMAIGALSIAALVGPAAAVAAQRSDSSPQSPDVANTTTARRVSADRAEHSIENTQRQLVTVCRANYRSADMLERCIEAAND